ncbi:MAG: hypothetical protein PHV30_09310 [Candidatus Margulisbacteria bacterium]|nr:hypothetical protein [Candidatus Margulisiibacteriota bacterium]
MLKKLYFALLCLTLIVVVTGCANYYLKPTGATKIENKGIIYEIIPYTAQIHQQYNMDPLFAELDYNTTFLIHITNLNNYPVTTTLANAFIFQDNTQLQYSMIRDPFIYFKDSLKKNPYSDLPYTDLRNQELEVQRLADQNVTTDNATYLKTNLADLKYKIYTMEQNQLFQEELSRREKNIKAKLEQYGFKDQIIYAQGNYLGLLIFPPVSREKLNNSTLFYTLPDKQVISVSFTLQNN